MKPERTSIWIGGIGLTYWPALAVFILRDLYLDYALVGTFLKLLTPCALLANLLGIGLGLASWRKNTTLACVAIGLNTLPIVGVLWFLWWLFFGLRI